MLVACRDNARAEFLLRNPDAIVPHPYEARASRLNIQLDALRAGIKTILDQFLDGRRRSLDDFSGRDLVDEFRRQDAVWTCMYCSLRVWTIRHFNPHALGGAPN